MEGDTDMSSASKDTLQVTLPRYLVEQLVAVVESRYDSGSDDFGNNEVFRCLQAFDAAMAAGPTLTSAQREALEVAVMQGNVSSEGRLHLPVLTLCDRGFLDQAGETTYVITTSGRAALRVHTAERHSVPAQNQTPEDVRQVLETVSALDGALNATHVTKSGGKYILHLRDGNQVEVMTEGGSVQVDVMIHAGGADLRDMDGDLLAVVNHTKKVLSQLGEMYVRRD